MHIPEKMEAHDPRVLVNSKTLPIPFRIIDNALYTLILKAFKEVRQNDIKNAIVFSSHLLDFETRQFIQKFITENDKQKP